MLVVTPEPKPREGLLGYMLRITEANGYDSPWHIYRHAGLEQDEMNTACLSAHKLAGVLGQDVARIETMSYTHTSDEGDTTYRIAGHDLGSGLMTRPFRLAQQGLCPLCAQESGYVDVFWDLRIATACPFHGCQALMQCPTCLSPLRQFRPAPLICKCGTDLASAPMEAASAGEVDLMKVLYARLHDERTILENTTTGLPIDHLLELPLRSLMVHLFRLGAFVLNEPYGKAPAQDSVLAVANLLSDWPNGLSTFLRGEMAKRNPDETNFLKFYNRFYQQFVKSGRRRSGQELPWIRQAFLDFGVREWNGAAVDARLVAQTEEKKKRLNRHELASVLGVSAGTLSKWMRVGMIDETMYVRAGSRRYGFDSDNLNAAANSEATVDILETRAAAAYLGIPVSALQFLKENCLLGTRDPRLQRRGYFRLDLERVRQQLLDKAQLISTGTFPAPESVLVLGWFLKFSHPRDKTIKGRLLAAILTGEVHPLGRHDDRISSILIKKSDLDCLRDQKLINQAAIRCSPPHQGRQHKPENANARTTLPHMSTHSIG